MKNGCPSSGNAPAKKRIRDVVLEALLVGSVGFGLAMVANAVSPRGLVIRRDYFPKLLGQTTPVTNRIAITSQAVGETNQTTGDKVAERLAARGLRAIDIAAAQKLYEDPRREQERIIFVDSRNEEAYLEGHVPGAYAFDHYYPDKYLPEVLPACQQAELVVVYCTGGDCEDSEFAAVYLINAGVPADRVNVLTGGMEAWKTNGMPVEIGPRGSGETGSKQQ